MSLTSDLHAWVETQMKTFDVPGAAIAMVRGDEVLLHHAFGVDNIETGTAVGTDTSFALASVTKAFTAAGVGALVDDGVLGWDEPVRRYLADFELRDQVASHNITVRDMLCHRSGLPRHDIVWYGDRGTERAELVRRLRHLESNKSFRSTWQYNNLMYATAGYLCEVVSGTSWEDLVRSRLLHPLGMDATTFGYDEAGGVGPVAVPHAPLNDETVRIAYSPGSFLTGPAGSMYSTLDDMATWLRASLNDGSVDGQQVLAPATMRTMLAPQMVTPEASLFPETRDSAYGMGWMLGTYRGHKLAYHGGSIDGFSSLVTMLPDDDIGMVCLLNKGATTLHLALSFHAFDVALGLDEVPWDARINELETTRRAGAQAARSRSTGTGSPAPAHPLDDYVGRYEHPAYGHFDIERRPDGLVPAFRDLTLRLTHRHYETFDLEIDPWESERWTVSFRTDVDGAVDALSIPLEPTVAPIVFDRLPDAELGEPDYLARIEGRYSMGPIEVDVKAQSDRVTASVAGQLPLTLTPHLGGAFKLQGNDVARVRFEQADDGTIGAMVLSPIGVFLRVAD